MQTIKIGGEERPIRCSWKQLKKLARKKQIKALQKLGEAIATLELDEIAWFLHVCLKDAADKEGDSFAYSVEEVDEWLDEGGFPAITEFLEKVSQSLTGKQDEPGNVDQPEPEVTKS